MVWGLWEREGDSLSYYLVYITQLNATHVDFVLHLSHPDGKLLTRSYNRSEPVLVVDKTPKMTDISVGSRVITVHRRTHKEWYKNGMVIRTSRSNYAYVRFNSGTERWVPLWELRLEKRPRLCTTGAWGRHRALIGSILKSAIKLSNERPVVVSRFSVKS